jgi:chemotaxis response regulator CheB
VVADHDRRDSAEDVATALRPGVVLIDVSPEQFEGLELARRLSAYAEPPATCSCPQTPRTRF